MTNNAQQAWNDVGDKFSVWGRRVADRYREDGQTAAAAAQDSERELQRVAREIVAEVSRGLAALGKTLNDEQANKEFGAAVAAIGDAITATVNEASQAVRPGGTDKGNDRVDPDQ